MQQFLNVVTLALPRCVNSTSNRKRSIFGTILCGVGVALFSLLFSLTVTIPTAYGQTSFGPALQTVFEEDFENGSERWEVLDPKTWKLAKDPISGNTTFEITRRESEYKPPVRSPLHVALIKDLVVGNVQLTFKVRSTLDTGGHRDGCIFFGYQDDQHFYYAHLGANPDPHSGQIMIVREAPRLALTKNESKTPWDDQWHTVRLVRNVDTGLIQIFFDDLETPHMQVTDKTFGAGRVGIGSFDDLNEFDDVVVKTF